MYTTSERDKKETHEAFGAMDDDAFIVPNSYFVVLVKPFVRKTCDSSHECISYGTIFVPCRQV